MLKKLILIGLLSLAASPLEAVTWYFSDCATGGDGSVTNPFCLQPPNSATTNYSTKVSIDTLFDTTATTGGCYTPPCTNGLQEAKAGDVIQLCCGGADGCGDATTTCTYTVGTTSSAHEGIWWTPDLNPGNIQLMPYPGDIVTISGDTDGDGVGEQPGDVGTIAYIQGQHFYTITSITFDRFTENGFYFDASNYGAPTEGDWAFDRVFIDEIGKDAWGDTDGLGNTPSVEGTANACDGINDPACCPSRGGSGCSGCTIDGSTGGYAMYMGGINKPISFQNGGISRTCGFAIRDISSFGSNHEVLFRNNTFTNNTIIGNVWGSYDWQNLRGQTFKFIDNYVEGWADGLVLENQNRGVIIDHNTFNCSGTYHMMTHEYEREECWPPIEINGGDFGNDRNGGNAGHQITRNTIYGARKSGDSAALAGWLWGGVSWNDGCRKNSHCTAANTPWCCCLGDGTGVCNSTTAGGTCDSGSPSMKYGCNPDVQYGSLIENNIIYSTQSQIGGVDVSRAGIGINTNNPVAIVNNTVVGNENSALYLNDGAASVLGETQHPVSGNIFGYASGTEVFLATATVESGLTNNHIYAPSGNIFQRSGSSALACASIDTINALDSNSGNVCASPPVFVSQSGTNYPTWDPHLLGTDSTNYNALASGPAYDVDIQSRPFDSSGVSLTPYDRGADEVRPPDFQIPVFTVTSTSGDAVCDVSNGEEITLNISYSNNITGGGTGHNVVLWVTTIGTVANHLSYSSSTCPNPGGNGDFDLGDLGPGENGNCDVVYTCVHSGGGEQNTNTIYAYMLSDEVPVEPTPPLRSTTLQVRQ